MMPRKNFQKHVLHSERDARINDSHAAKVKKYYEILQQYIFDQLSTSTLYVWIYPSVRPSARTPVIIRANAHTKLVLNHHSTVYTTR